VIQRYSIVLMKAGWIPLHAWHDLYPEELNSYIQYAIRNGYGIDIWRVDDN
jgi:hypothetical protein